MVPGAWETICEDHNDPCRQPWRDCAGPVRRSLCPDHDAGTRRHADADNPGPAVRARDDAEPDARHRANQSDSGCSANAGSNGQRHDIHRCRRYHATRQEKEDQETRRNPAITAVPAPADAFPSGVSRRKG
eukprot:gene371-541_t